MSSTKLRPLGTDETPVKKLTIDAEGQSATYIGTVRPVEGGPQYNLQWKFDFSTCTPEEVLRLAARSIVIAKQGEWRKDKEQTNAERWHEVMFNVHDMLAEGRKTADPFTRAKGAAAKLSKAEREALIKQLQGMED
jgi:hypothetical protein